ncbi:MAG: hypothetical protein H6R15_2170, partial [Proteobacteria bacterium]|nr:hypothetical protein [Pseudomonadota bacterium]
MAQAQVIAKVSSIHGEAFARDSSGKLRRLKVGDALRENESVVAADGSQVFLKLADGREMQVRPGETIKLDAEVGAMLKPDAADSAISNPPKSFAKIAKVVASGGKLDDVLEEPAAGNVAGGNEGHTFVELLRISETVDPQASFLLAGSGERNGSRGTGTEAPILGSETPITVFAPDNTNDNTPTITGQSALLPGGSITLTITDGAGLVQTVATTVRADGSFSVDVPTPLAEGNYSVLANGSDAAGNSGRGSDNGSVDTIPPALTAELDPASDSGAKGDGITNDTTPTIRGQGEPGARIEVVMPGTKEVLSTTVKADGSWSVTPGQNIPNGTHGPALVSETDSAGNISTRQVDLSIDNSPPAISINLDTTIAGDGIVNKSESTAAAIPVSGTVSGEFNVGDPVIVSVNGKDFATTVLAGGRFSVNVPGADLAADADRIIDARVSSSDAAGNTSTAQDAQNYTVSTTPPAIAISLDANVAGDGIVNKSESTATAIPVTGTVSGAFNVGDPVIVTVNGKEFATTVLAGGRFSVNVPGADLAADPDRIVDAKVSTVDAAGNTATALDTQNYTVNTTPPAIAISLDANVAGDGIVNRVESTSAAIPVTGTVSGVFNVGDPIIVSVNGKQFATTVLAGGRFSVDVPGADLAADPDRIVDAKVSTVDAAGNTATALDTQNYAVNTAPPAIAISLDANVAGDGIVNKSESTAAAIPVTGTVSGAFNVGDPVIVTVNGKEFATTVLAGGRFSVDVPGADLAADPDRIVDAKVSTVDAAGNTATALDTQNYTVNTTPPAIAISLDANVAGDGIVNKSESTAAAIPVTGTVSGAFNVGDPVIVTVNGKDFATTVLAGGRFSVNVPGADLAADADRIVDAKVS